MRNHATPPPDCRLHPSLRVRSSAIEGHGLFAAQRLPAGTIVITLGGHLVSTEELSRLLRAAERDGRYVDTIAVDEDRHLILPPGQPIHYGNHSCDPNLWHVDAVTLATRRDVPAGAEVTVDYATQTAEPDFRMACGCGSANCRGPVTGDDWRIPQWRRHYGDHVVPAVARRIAGL